MCERIVTLIDMDCFFCQVEVKLKPEYTGKPLAVVQYNPWRGGGYVNSKIYFSFGLCDKLKKMFPNFLYFI